MVLGTKVVSVAGSEHVERPVEHFDRPGQYSHDEYHSVLGNYVVGIDVLILFAFVNFRNKEAHRLVLVRLQVTWVRRYHMKVSRMFR